MLSRGGIVAIVVGSIVYWVLEGLMYGMVLADSMKSAMEAYSSVMNPPDDGNMFIWFVPTTLAALLLMWLGSRSTVTIGGMATMGAVLYGAFCFMMEFSMSIGMVNYPFMSWSIMAIGWEIVAGGIVGAAMGFVYTKLNP